jgi:type III secretion protein Q
MARFLNLPPDMRATGLQPMHGLRPAPALAVRRLGRAHLALERRPEAGAVARGMLARAAAGLTGALGSAAEVAGRRLDAVVQAPACLSRTSVFAVLELSALGSTAVLEVGQELVAALAAALAGAAPLASPVAALAPLELSAAGYLLLAALAEVRALPAAERLWAPRLLSLDEGRDAVARALGSAPLVAFEGTVRVEGTVGRYDLFVPEPSLRASVALLPEEPTPELTGVLGRAEVPAAVVIGRAHLDRAAAASLRRGDVVVLPGCRLEEPGPAGRAAVRADAFLLDGELSAAGLTVRAVRPRSPIEVPTMSSAPESELPVEVEVELARVRLPVSQLAVLRIGSVLPLHVGAGDPVLLRVGDRAVGRAELVDIEGELGARVLALFD